jgi:hypothetical protein
MKWTTGSAVVLNIAPDRLTFTDMDGEPVSLPPFVHVVSDGSRTRVLAVRDGDVAPTGATRVAVLSPDPAPRGMSKFDCLAALFTQGLKAILDRSLFRRKPEVLVRGAETLSATFGGYERDLITAALAQAGARRVRWPEEFVA